MNIFESLENLNVSEECFDDILSIVEDVVNEDLPSYIKRKKLDPIHNAGVRMVKDKSEKDAISPYASVNYTKSFLKDEGDKFYKTKPKGYWNDETDAYGKDAKKDYFFSGYDRNADVMRDVGKQTGSKALEKASEKTRKYSDMLKKARELHSKNTDSSDAKKTKVEKGNEKTKSRRYGTKDVTDRTGFGEYEVVYHKGDAKGYPHNEIPKSDEQRIKDSIARNKAKKNS